LAPFVSTEKQKKICVKFDKSWIGLQLWANFSAETSGVDVMITIFSDFSKFLAKQLAFFLKTDVMIIFCTNYQHLELKTPIFPPNFSAKIFKKS
jgi:hypothetical protein